MKFKCGPTIAERAAKEKAEQEKLHANFVWKPWFAWRPMIKSLNIHERAEAVSIGRIARR